MNPSPRPAAEETQRELSTEWLELSGRIRELASRLKPDTDPEVRQLARESLRMCGHVERLHADVERWLGELAPTAGAEPAPHDQEESEDDEALNIQREIHQDKVSVRDVIKALFLWQDTPDDRMRQQQEERDKRRKAEEALRESGHGSA